MGHSTDEEDYPMYGAERSSTPSHSRADVGNVNRDATMEAFLSRYRKMRVLVKEQKRRNRQLTKRIHAMSKKRDAAEEDNQRAQARLNRQTNINQKALAKYHEAVEDKQATESHLTEVRHERTELQRSLEILEANHEKRRYELKKETIKHTNMRAKALKISAKLEAVDEDRLELKEEIQEHENKAAHYQRKLDEVKSDMAEMRNVIHMTIARSQAMNY